MSHLIIALILAEILNIKKKSIVVLGALAPDLIAKIHLIYFYLGIKPIILFTSFHTPLMCFLLSLVMAPWFRYNFLKFVISFNVGSLSQFLSDLTMKHFTVSGTRFLFPFSMNNYTLNLIWPNHSFYILAVSLVVYLAIKFLRRSYNVKYFKIRYISN